MEKQNNRSQYVWGMIAPLIIMFIVQFAVEFFTVEVLFVYRIGSYNSGSYFELVSKIMNDVFSGTTNAAVSISYAVICIVLFGYSYFTRFSNKEKLVHPFRNLTSNVWLMLAGLIILAFGMQYVCLYVSNAVAMIRPDWYEEYQKLLDVAGLVDNINILMGLYACIFAPICEEVAFRGLVFSNAKKVMPTALAIVVQAALFGAFHQNMFQASYTFIVGLGLGYVMYKYNNLVAVIGIHIIYNVIGTFVNEYLPTGGSSFAGFFAWLLGSLIVTYIGVLILKKAAPEVNNLD